MVKIVDASEVKRQPRKAPATRMIESLPPGLMTARQVAEQVRREHRDHPSSGAREGQRRQRPVHGTVQGGEDGELIIWVYTAEDINELAEYFGERVPKLRGAKKKG